MNQTVYFTDCALHFVEQLPDNCPQEAVLKMPSSFHEGELRDKILKMLENHNTIYCFSAHPAEDFEIFSREFTYVEAAGGVVVDEKGRWLMMRRNARWDFPKGHVERGETYEECAQREIEEETGVRGRVETILCQTLHAYFFPKTNRWELKRTYWYRLALETEALKPQEEEGIVLVKWAEKEEVEENLKDTFPTIRQVAEAMMKSLHA